MLNLIVASILTLATLADLESVTEEWIAPGVDITKETLVEFAEHGEMFQSASEPYVGCHVTFVEVNGREKWRAVVVYADRVVLFQEDQEPVVTLHDFQVDNCSFSESGNYVVLHDGGVVDTDRNGLRINTETGESIFFDAQPEGLFGRAVATIWNDGRMQFAREKEFYEYGFRRFWLDAELNIINTVDMYFPTLQSISSSSYMIAFSGLIHCYNTDAEEIWAIDIPVSRRAIAGPVISEANGSFLIATSNGIQVRSITTGELLYNHPILAGSLPWQIFTNSDNASFSCYFFTESEGGNSYYRYNGSLLNNDGSSSSLAISSSKYRIVGNSGHNILIRRSASRNGRISPSYMLISKDYDVKYAIPTVPLSSVWGITHQGKRAAISDSGNRILVNNNNQILSIEL